MTTTTTGKVENILNAMVAGLLLTSGADAKVLRLPLSSDSVHDINALDDPRGFAIQVFPNAEGFNYEGAYRTEVEGAHMLLGQVAEELQSRFVPDKDVQLTFTEQSGIPTTLVSFEATK